MTTAFSPRIANLDDAPAVSTLLKASYSQQLADGYGPEVLAKALPFMTRANPRLLASGTYYVVEIPNRLIGCGGWSKEPPGSREIKEGLAHIRHFATHPGWLRHGIGRALLSRCFHEAAMEGISSLECHSTLVAVDFYLATGFTIVRPLQMQLAPEISIDGMLLRRNLP